MTGFTGEYPGSRGNPGGPDAPKTPEDPDPPRYDVPRRARASSHTLVLPDTKQDSDNKPPGSGVAARAPRSARLPRRVKGGRHGLDIAVPHRPAIFAARPMAACGSRIRT